MKTFRIISLGCKVNRYESDAIAAQLVRQGWQNGNSKSQQVDLCIINTCAVTAKSAAQSCQEIRKLLRKYPECRLMATGCHAQTDPSSIAAIQGVEQIIGHREKYRIPLLAEKAPCPALVPVPVDHGPTNTFLDCPYAVKGSMTRAYLKIQDGCNAFCSYCIVPYARGGSVSMEPSQVMDHLSQLADAGFKEVIFTGIHTGLYGRDLSPATTLSDLLEKIDECRPVERIRLSSIEPAELDDRLIDLASEGHILCDHFHIPLQSGDDRILQAMKRPYTSGLFRDLICKIRKRLPMTSIGVDTLIGFPGETNQEFENTYELIRDLPVSYLHVFPFSPRKGTPAFDFTPKVPPDVLRERCQKMRELGMEKKNEFIGSNKGKILRGLVQHTPDSATGELIAMTDNYLKVHLPWQDGLAGTMINLTLEMKHSHDSILRGRIVESSSGICPKTAPPNT